MSTDTDDPVGVECAAWLIRIAKELRSVCDVGLVKMDESGVAPAPFTLAGELELIAMQLDMTGCMEQA